MTHDLPVHALQEEIDHGVKQYYGKSGMSVYYCITVDATSILVLKASLYIGVLQEGTIVDTNIAKGNLHELDLSPLLLISLLTHSYVSTELRVFLRI